MRLPAGGRDPGDQPWMIGGDNDGALNRLSLHSKAFDMGLGICSSGLVLAPLETENCHGAVLGRSDIQLCGNPKIASASRHFVVVWLVLSGQRFDALVFILSNPILGNIFDQCFNQPAHPSYCLAEFFAA